MKTCPKCKGTGKVPGEGLEKSVHCRYWDKVMREQLERVILPPILPVPNIFRPPDPAPHARGASLMVAGQRWAWVLAGLPTTCGRCGEKQGGVTWWWVAVDGDEDRIIGRMCNGCMQATTQDET